MFKLSRVFLPMVALSLLVGCSSDSVEEAINDILNKDMASVALSNLSGHAVTYENTVDQSTHTEGYCSPAILTTNGEDTIGIWSLASANELNSLTTAGTINHAYTTTDGTLVKNVTYDTTTTTPGSTTTDPFKVTNISEILCVVSL